MATLADQILEIAYSLHQSFKELRGYVQAISPHAFAQASTDLMTGLNLEEDTKKALVIGLCCGVGVLSFLLFFPGEPFDYSKVDGGQRKKEKRKNRPKNKSGRNLIIEEIEKSEKARRGENANTKARTESAETERETESEQGTRAEPVLDINWDVERIKSKTKKMQKLFRLTDEQMTEVILSAKQVCGAGQSAKRDLASSVFVLLNDEVLCVFLVINVPNLFHSIISNNSRPQEAADEERIANEVGGEGSDNSYSLSQKVDVMVYSCLFALLIYFLQRDFGPQLNLFLTTNFPKEAKALGIETDRIVRSLKGNVE